MEVHEIGMLYGIVARVDLSLEKQGLRRLGRQAVGANNMNSRDPDRKPTNSRGESRGGCF